MNINDNGPSFFTFQYRAELCDEIDINQWRDWAETELEARHICWDGWSPDLYLSKDGAMLVRMVWCADEVTVRRRALPVIVSTDCEAFRTATG